MRTTKVVAALLAILLALALAVTTVITLSASVDAAPAPRHPRHNLKVDAKELNSANVFVLFGKVPTYPGHKIVLTRSLDGGKYHR